MNVPLRPPARFTAWLLMGCLAGALLLAQTLGLMHGVVHSGEHSGAHSREHRAGNQHHLQLPDVAHIHAHGDAEFPFAGWLALIFSSHDDGDADCRLFDQASHGSAVPAFMQSILPTLPPSVVVAIFQGEALARWAALFDARGPPLTH